jgi:hypothetical protein
MCLTVAVDDNAEHDGIDDQSSVNVMQVIVVPQLGGCRGQRRGNNAARLTIVLACGCRCGRQQTTTTSMATVTVAMGMRTKTTTAAAVAAAAKKTKVVTHRQQSTKIGSRRNISSGGDGNGNDNSNNNDDNGDSGDDYG